MNTIHLRGMTWDHTRGVIPLQAAAQRFHELHPEVEITWEKRSLKSFGDQPLQALAPHFDLLVIDHPFVGYASAHDVLRPLDDLLPPGFLAEQADHAVGASHASYTWLGRQWALAIDAATPVSVRRPDLLAHLGLAMPDTWEDVLALAERGVVIFPGKAIDSLMHFWMLCVALGDEPGAQPDRLVDPAVGTAALQRLRDLADRCPPACLDWNPIRICEELAAGREAAYCPFAYGYSNYARDGYAANLLSFGPLVKMGARRLRSVLGGTGLALSSSCRHPEMAAAFAAAAASPGWQRTLYTWSGGQPGHRAAWLDEESNRLTHGYFRDTLPTLDEAWLRPRYDGYLHLQDRGAEVLHDWLRVGGPAATCLKDLERLHAESRKGHAS